MYYKIKREIIKKEKLCKKVIYYKKIQTILCKESFKFLTFVMRIIAKYYNEMVKSWLVL